MRHYQDWKSEEAKVKVWLELCDLSARLMFEGLMLVKEDRSLAEKELWSRLKAIRERHRLINQETMVKIA
ncbi:hypothetical protein KKG61_07010 [bacterium]|nr:hypothetical protein [bacterium]